MKRMVVEYADVVPALEARIKRLEELLQKAEGALDALIACHLDYCDAHSLTQHPTNRGHNAMDRSIDVKWLIRGELGDAS